MQFIDLKIPYKESPKGILNLGHLDKLIKNALFMDTNMEEVATSEASILLIN